MRNANLWTALAVAVPMLFMTAPLSLASPKDAPQDKPAAEVSSEAPSDPGTSAFDDAQDDVTVLLHLDDNQASSPDDNPAPDESAKPEKGKSPVDPDFMCRIKQTAMKYVGTPYRWGGTTPAAFDCSGFTRYVYNSMGITLPRMARDQYKAGTPVKREDLQPGDLIFFDMSKGYVSHVGMYLGDGKFIHASTPATGVKTDDLNARTYVKCFVGARRYYNS